MGAIIALILFIAKPIWFSDRYGETAVKLMSLGVAGTTVFALLGWPQLLENYLKPYLKQHYPSIEVQSLEPLSIVVLLAIVVIIYIVNRPWKDNTGMGVHPNSIDLDIPEPSFKKKLTSVSTALTDEIRNTDNNLNWNNLRYIDLDAEILVKNKEGLKRKYGSLLKALKNSDGKLFLLLGSPGAGKSVALRKLCIDLEKEVTKTEKIPVYVNLRGWKNENSHWSSENLPSIEDLESFIKNNVLHRDIVSKRFFETYYDKLYQNGRLFFILDSFDEIPSILGEKENSLLIDHLSKIIFKFLKGARYEYQGVLASRMFRHPTSAFQETITLEILAFNDEKIINNFEQDYIEQSVIKEIFSERSDLLNISRNPFYSSLLCSYISNNKVLPNTVAEIFSDYFNKSLTDGASFIEERGLTVESVLESVYSISYAIFHDENIEISSSELKKKLPSLPIDDILDILEFCRIGRVGNISKKFSFSHRRLMEYLAIKKIIVDGNSVPYEMIPENSKWFDSLSIYCEIAPLEKANEIADFCCNIIEESNSINEIKTKRSLRFLLSAFLNRRACIRNHQGMLEKFFHDQLYKNNDVFSVLLVIKSISLIEDRALIIIRSSLYILNNHIVSMELIKAMRTIKIAPEFFIKEFKEFIINQPILWLLVARKKLIITLSLSNKFNNIKKLIDYRIASYFF